MPKLKPSLAKTVAKSKPVTSSGYEPLPPGKYVAHLRDVVAKLSAAGSPVWDAQWDRLYTLDELEAKPGRQFFTINLPTSDTRPDGWGEAKPGDPDDRWAKFQQRCMGQLHAFFLAHGYSPDSDTDEMLGEPCVITVGVEIQQKGAKAGQERNVVTGFQSLEDLGIDPADLPSGADDDDDEEPPY